MSEFLTLGEPLVVFASQDMDASLTDAVHFKKYLAGAELNVAIGVTRLGHTSQYISQLGADSFGDFILKGMQAQGIETDAIQTTSAYHTGFYFKEKVGSGDPKVAYFRKNSAASHFDAAQLSELDLREVKIAHLSGIMAAISKEGQLSVKTLLTLLQEKGITTTFDPNLRSMLWSSEKEMVETLNALAKLATIVLPGVNEGEILVGTSNLEGIADFYLNQSDITQTVIVKNGAKGAFVKVKGQAGYHVPGYKVARVLDTVGAGDGFATGLITGLLDDLPISAAVQRACAIGARAVQFPGDNDGYPTPEELTEFMKEGKH